MPDHADSSGFVVRISLRANPDDRVVINEVSIGGRAGLSIGFIVAG
jgi:phage head maturation protease